MMFLHIAEYFRNHSLNTRISLIFHDTPYSTWSRLAHSCSQWHVPPPQPQEREHQIICARFLPVGIIKLLRECVKWRVVLFAPSGMQPASCFCSQTFSICLGLSLSFWPSIILQCILHSLNSFSFQSVCVFGGQTGVPASGMCGGMQVFSIHTPKAERRGQFRDCLFSGTSLCTS